MNSILLVSLLLAPFVAVVGTRATANPRVARNVFGLATAATAAASILLGSRVFHAPSVLVSLELVSGRGLAFSAARAPFVCLATVVFLVVALVADRRQLSIEGARGSALALLVVVVAHLATDLVVLAAAFSALAVVIVSDVARTGDRESRTDARMIGALLAIGTLALVVGAVATGGTSVLAPLATDAHAALDSSRVPEVARDALVLVSMVGLAVFPLHLHLPRIFAKASLGPAVALVLVQPALVVAMHAVLPTLGSKEGTVMSVLATFSVVAAAYAAFGSLGQRELRPMIGYLVSSQNGLVLAGLATRTTEGGVAAVLSSMATAIAGAGLLILAHEVESRAGHVDLRSSHGFAKPWPRLGVAYLLLSLATLGFPGSLQFFSEDLLLQGFLETHPFLAYAVLLVAASNGVTVLRSFIVLFFGPSPLDRADYVPNDIRRRELLGPAILLSALGFLVMVGPTIGALVER